MCSRSLLLCCTIFLLNAVFVSARGGSEQNASSKPSLDGVENALIVTQIPPASYPSNLRKSPKGHLTAESQGQLRAKNAFIPNGGETFLGFGEGARLIKVKPDSSIEELSRNFHSACDPVVSFDASHILFAGKRTAGDDWNIYEMKVDGSNVRQITDGIGNCRSPDYQATLYTIVSTEPWYQLTFVGMEKGASDEYAAGQTCNLYSCKLDGSQVRRLTFNLSDNIDPFIMSDGRLLFSGRHRTALGSELSGGPHFAKRSQNGNPGRISLFGINIDGADYALFHAYKGKRFKRMPCTTTKGLAVFIESDELRWDGAGSIGSALLRRPLHSYRQITHESEGLFHSPSPLADGGILVSRKSKDNTDTYGVYRLDPSDGELEMIFDSPEYHDIQAKMIYPRPEPDGRSSVVTEKDPNGKFYCIDVYINDLENSAWMPRGTAKRLRVIEGFRQAALPVIQRRILGEIDIEQDGSFNIEIPANTPIELQVLDADGLALRSCGWIWAKNHEPRGCIGCHEDGELTPENVLIDAVLNPSVKLNLPVERRRTVDFQRDVIPIILKKCVQCHGGSNSVGAVREPPLHSSPETIYKNLLTDGSRPGCGKYIHPERARTSPLIWHIFGRNTSRPWDDTFSRRNIPLMSPAEGQELTPEQKRTFAEWIDMGALWDGTPEKQKNGGSN